MSHKPRLLDQVREAVRLRHYSYRTEQQYIGWIRRYILFHGKRHPADLEGGHVEAFLSHLAVSRHVASATQAQALSALLFLYRHVLNVELPWLDSMVRAKRPKRLPVVLTRAECLSVLSNIDGACALPAKLLYGSGLRVLEALRLRVKDVNLHNRVLTIRDGKGAKDRITMLPEALASELRLHLRRVREQHHIAMAGGYGGVELPHALEVKYPRAPFEMGWQFVFPSKSPSRDPRSGAWRRHHLSLKMMQRRVKEAVRAAGIEKPVSCHTFRHCFATHMIESGVDIRTVQELMGHASVKTTQIYTHVLNRGGIAARSPLD